MNVHDLIRRLYGDPIDPLDNVAPAMLEEARKAVALWTGASRSELRQLISVVRKGKDELRPWKRQLMARILAKRALGDESDSVRKSVVAALAALDPDNFSAVAAL